MKVKHTIQNIEKDLLIQIKDYSPMKFECIEHGNIIAKQNGNHRFIYTIMRYLRKFNESIIAYNPKVKDYFPDTVELYTSDGSFKFKKSDVTLEADIIRAFYYQNTVKETGDPLSDGEPDTLGFDIHFVKNNNGFKTLVNITYGDQMKSEFSIESPNIIKIGHYNGIGSKSDPNSQFGLEDNTIKDLVKLFNSFNFGYNLAVKDFNFIDKYPDSYKYPDTPDKLNQTKLEIKDGDDLIIVINNSVSPDNNHLVSLLNYLQIKGIKYEVVLPNNDISNISKKYNIIGVILSGSNKRIGNSKIDLGNFTCPILGIGYGMQLIVNSNNGSISESNKLTHKHLKIDMIDMNNFLFEKINKNLEMSFSFYDKIDNLPDQFKVIAKTNDIIAAISSDSLNQYGLLFHPEDKESTYLILDNFINKCNGGIAEEQEKLLKGQFEKLKSFSIFKK